MSGELPVDCQLFLFILTGAVACMSIHYLFLLTGAVVRMLIAIKAHGAKELRKGTEAVVDALNIGHLVNCLSFSILIV